MRLFNCAFNTNSRSVEHLSSDGVNVKANWCTSINGYKFHFFFEREKIWRRISLRAGALCTQFVVIFIHSKINLINSEWSSLNWKLNDKIIIRVKDIRNELNFVLSRKFWNFLIQKKSLKMLHANICRSYSVSTSD